MTVDSGDLVDAEQSTATWQFLGRTSGREKDGREQWEDSNVAAIREKDTREKRRDELGFWREKSKR